MSELVKRVELRPATMADADLLLRWRNDPLTRKWSKQTEEISLDQHRVWLERALTDESRRLFLAQTLVQCLDINWPTGETKDYVETVLVGTGRIDIKGEHVEVSVTVAPEYRGHGYGSAIVRALVAWATSQGHEAFRARIKPANLQSLVSFLQAGWEPIDLDQFVILKPGGTP